MCSEDCHGRYTRLLDDAVSLGMGEMSSANVRSWFDKGIGKPAHRER